MPAPTGGTVTSLSSMVAYLRSKQNLDQGYSGGASQRDVTRFAPVFAPRGGIFGPGYPIVPPSRQPIRSWDYPAAWNVTFTPRSFEPVGFGELRSMADKHTLTRLAIETRKDQMAALPWRFRAVGTDGVGQQVKPSKDQQGRIDALTQFFKCPDGTHRFETWLRGILDDLLVIDAPAVELRQTRSGKITALDQLDGGLIKPLLDETGRRPKPPAPAYQQIIHGRPWVLLEDGGRADTDEGSVYASFNDGQLIYMPRNPRIYKGYGFSPVEQIFTYMQIGIRREARQLAHFTEGNIPPGMIDAPEGSSVEQVKEWQDWFDSNYGGNDSARTRLVWGPSGAKYQPFVEPPFKDDFDIWLARIVSYAFNLPTQWATAQVNRATAQTAQETALEEGLFPLKSWVVGFINLITQQRMGQPDIEFCWEDKQDVDPAVEATILDTYVRSGTFTLNEARERLGKPPVKGGEVSMVYLPTGPVLISDIEDLSDSIAHPPVPAPPGAANGPDGAPGKGTGKPKGKPAPTGAQTGNSSQKTAASEVAKSGSDPFGEPASRRYLTAARNSIAKALEDFFRGEPARIARDALTKNLLPHTWQKASNHTDPDQHGVKPLDDPHRAREISAAVAAALAGINWSGWSDLVGEISPHLEEAAERTATGTLAALGAELTPTEVEALKAAVRKWAQDRAAELVGQARIGSRVIPDTSADMDITGSTARMIADDVRQAIADRWGVEKLTQVLENSGAFSAKRARWIADYETKTALHTATMQTFKAARIRGSYWRTVADDRVETTCLINEAASPVPLGLPFPSGHTAPLAHAGCRCWLAPQM